MAALGCSKNGPLAKWMLAFKSLYFKFFRLVTSLYIPFLRKSVKLPSTNRASFKDALLTRSNARKSPKPTGLEPTISWLQSGNQWWDAIELTGLAFLSRPEIKGRIKLSQLWYHPFLSFKTHWPEKHIGRKLLSTNVFFNGTHWSKHIHQNYLSKI